MYSLKENSENKMILFKIAVFLYTFFIFSRSSTAGISISSVLLILSLILFRSEWSQIKREPINNFLLCYIIFFGALFLAAIITKDTRVFDDTWRYFTWTIPFFVYYFSFSIYSFEGNYISGIALAILTIGCATFYDIYMHLSTISFFKNDIRGYFVSHNHLAMVLSITLPVLILSCVHYRKKITNRKWWILLLTTIIGVFSLYISGSRGGFSGFILGFIALILGKYLLKRKLRYSVAAFFLILVLLAGGAYGIYNSTENFQRSYDKERVLLIESSYAMWNDHKLYGVGFERWKDEYPKYISPEAKEPDLPMPHNTIAYFFSTTGLIGGTGFLVYTIGIIVILLKAISKYPSNLYYQAALWSFIALSIHGMVDTGITNKAAMQIISGVLGVAFASENCCMRTISAHK